MESKTPTINIIGFNFYLKNYILLENIVSEKGAYIITFYLRFYALQDI